MFGPMREPFARLRARELRREAESAGRRRRGAAQVRWSCPTGERRARRMRP